ncbi:hypothetical protein Poly24_04140 [Rosistilla carotiformis]|uniref:DUF1795 domain-containing protein n=1 Tax=Rosistilla carotiformis TaxID=2528017 RepID=A0A518JML9_9BACT|nr:hypothetical protein [Rosistilla carotiformis]QDV66727.1 hypothetical protein Poly24_04140 [Rosistilla carotiformis]
MYPDNWELTGPVEDGDSEGYVVESPTGMFFSLNRFGGRNDHENILKQACLAMDAEYDEVESEVYAADGAFPEEVGVEMQFYCKSLVITSRLLAMQYQDDVLLVQMQAENRDFDQNELVFAAMLKTVRDGLA